MNLIEAIKSGRPFRRQSAGGKWFTPLTDDQGLASSKDDILAEDWEIQEPKVEITRAQFWEAVNGSAKLTAIYKCEGGLLNQASKLLTETKIGDYVSAQELASRLGLSEGGEK